jgi:cytochrome c-type biogenesis protein CcmH/NrfG
VTTYQKLAAQQPHDPTVQEQLGYTAWVAGKTSVAIAAYTEFLKLDPTSTDAPAVRQRLKALKAQLKAQAKVKTVTAKKSGR